MNTFTSGGKFQFTRYILFFLIILIQACASTSGMRLEGNDFNENLPGRWEGYWRTDLLSAQATQGIKITKIDGSKVHLTGYANQPAGPPLSEVYGRVENSILFLTWKAPEGECEDEYIMKRDNSNNLILDGNYSCPQWSGKAKFKKIE